MVGDLRWFTSKEDILYYQIISNIEICDPEENMELTKILDEMTEEDLKIADEYDILEI